MRVHKSSGHYEIVIDVVRWYSACRTPEGWHILTSACRPVKSTGKLGKSIIAAVEAFESKKVA